MSEVPPFRRRAQSVHDRLEAEGEKRRYPPVEPPTVPPPDRDVGAYPPEVQEGMGSQPTNVYQAPPSPPAQQSKGVTARIEGLSKPAVAIVAVVSSVLFLVDIGTRVAARNDAYATKGQLEEIKADVKEAKTELKDAVKLMRDTLDALKINDIQPKLAQAQTTIAEHEKKIGAIDARVAGVVKAIKGFNAVENRRGHPSPLPIQDENP